jgi:hypothetical protein
MIFYFKSKSMKLFKIYKSLINKGYSYFKSKICPQNVIFQNSKQLKNSKPVQKLHNLPIKFQNT